MTYLWSCGTISDGCRSASSQPHFFFPFQHINPQQQRSRQIRSQMTSWINFFCKCETLQDKLQANLMGITGLGPYLPIPIIPVSTTGVHNLEKTLYTSLYSSIISVIRALKDLNLLLWLWPRPATQPFWFSVSSSLKC